VSRRRSPWLARLTQVRWWRAELARLSFGVDRLESGRFCVTDPGDRGAPSGVIAELGSDDGEAATGREDFDCSRGALAGQASEEVHVDADGDARGRGRPPDGDGCRPLGPPFQQGESHFFMGINRNKRDIVVDLKTAEGQAIVRDLAGWCDVLVQNMRPGAADEYGFGYETLRRDHPGLIYVTNTVMDRLAR